MRELSINNFKKVVSITYQGEEYSVRDNGAVCRMRRPNRRKRPLDGVWTIGKQCATHGYMRMAGLVVHKMIATAFHGEQPSSAHIVDHIDTNRRNNRVENLRWLTRLENLTSNPKTLRRIEQKWGSIEGMLQDPNRAEKVEPLSKRSWMPQKAEEIVHEVTDTESFTPIAMQRNWKTPSAFPSCPDKITDQPLKNYLDQLQGGSIFSHNRFGETLVEIAVLSADGSFLSVVTKIIDGVKSWGLAKITHEKGRYVHAAHGTFFTLIGAEKRHSEMLGKFWEGADSIDDYC